MFYFGFYPHIQVLSCLIKKMFFFSKIPRLLSTYIAQTVAQHILSIDDAELKCPDTVSTNEESGTSNEDKSIEGDSNIEAEEKVDCE